MRAAIIAAVVASFAVAANPVFAQSDASSGAASAPTQAQAQAELDAAIAAVRSDVASASTEFSSDATPTLASTASKFASDNQTILSGLGALSTAAQAVTLPPAALLKLAGDLNRAHALEQQADAINATSTGTDDCEQIARLYDKLSSLLSASDAANASQDDVLEMIKALFASGSGIDKTSVNAINSDILQKLALSNAAAADVNGVLVEAARDDAKKGFYQNCGSFAGPFFAVMTAHFMTKAGQEWWTYSTEIKGLVRLHYSLKDAQAGGSAKLAGEIFGNATQFTYKTDPYNTAYVKIVAGGRVEKTETPPVADDITQPTYVNAQTSPVGFVDNATGTMTARNLTVQLTDSLKDFDPDYAQGTTTAVIFSPLTNLMPVKNSYRLPYKNARWILDRFFARGLTMDITTNPTGERTAFFQDQKTLPGNQNSAEYTIAVSACDPACVVTQ